jgi:hypothetical protein
MHVKTAPVKKLKIRTTQHYGEGEIYDRKEAGEKCQQYYTADTRDNSPGNKINEMQKVFK